jgi:SAM-dependent methyltransferase
MAVDAPTAEAYATHAGEYADDWLSQPAPADLQRAVLRWFAHGPATRSADIGSGSGRDVDWLDREGYPTVGYEPGDALRAEAIARFPQANFLKAELPELAGVPSHAFDNVLCETVLMHLPRTSVGAAVAALRRILKPGGTLYLSWRLGEQDTRDARGRLYSAIPPAMVDETLTGMDVLHAEDVVSVSSGKRIRIVVARATG